MSIVKVKGATRHHIYLRDGDFDYLRHRFPTLGANGVVRRRVAALVDELRSEPQEAIPEKIMKELEKETKNG